MRAIMATYNDIINNKKFADLVHQYMDITKEQIAHASYEIEEIARPELNPTGLAIQKIEFQTPGKDSRLAAELVNVTFLIIYQPEQEAVLGNHDAYAERTFPNYMFMVDNSEQFGKCQFREMTSAGPKYGMKSAWLKDFNAAIELVVQLAHNVNSLSEEVRRLQAKISRVEETIKSAVNYYQSKNEELVAAAALPQALER